MAPTTDRLFCPRCARSYGLDRSLCDKCGLPLVYSPQAVAVDPSDASLEHEARKVNPSYSTGDLVKVARGGNQAEAEMIQQMLLTEGIPTILRRSAGFDVPDFLAAGPRDVLAPESGAAAARRLLQQAEFQELPSNGAGRELIKPWRVLAWIIVAVLIGGSIAWLLFELMPLP